MKVNLSWMIQLFIMDGKEGRESVLVSQYPVTILRLMPMIQYCIRINHTHPRNHHHQTKIEYEEHHKHHSLENFMTLMTTGKTHACHDEDFGTSPLEGRGAFSIISKVHSESSCLQYMESAMTRCPADVQVDPIYGIYTVRSFFLQ